MGFPRIDLYLIRTGRSGGSRPIRASACLARLSGYVSSGPGTEERPQLVEPGLVRKVLREFLEVHFLDLGQHAEVGELVAPNLVAVMDIPTAQALGGWSSPDVLLNVYAHPVSERIWSSAEFMDRLTKK